jgi:hypothetical protein
MKTYVYHKIDRAQGRRRLEIKEPHIRTIGEQPRSPMMEVPLSPMMPSVRWGALFPVEQSMHIAYEKMLFEHVRLSTFVWQESHNDNETSFGYYDRIDSYACVPAGVNFDGAFVYETGTDIYGYLNTVPLTGAQSHIVREKMRELEESLARLNTRPILSERELSDMRREMNAVEVGERELPRRLREYDYFENNNDEFTVE